MGLAARKGLPRRHNARRANARQDTRMTDGSGFSRRERVRAVAVALGVVLLASGCLFGRARERDLRDAARSLLPPGASVVVEEAGDCVELAPSPSCVHVWFVTEPGPLPHRVRAVRERADAAGWELERDELLAGGANVRFRRGRLRASVYLSREERAGPCREAPHKDCADAILVERG
jgi:hypothetical protein